MKKLCVFLVSVVFVGINFLQAQNVQVTGTVTSAEDGMPIPGASIMIKGTTTGVATNLDGTYSLSVPNTASILVFSSIGMTEQDVMIGGRTIINVVLEVDATELEEIVVVGYGSAKKVGTVVGSVSKVSSEKISSKPQATVLEAMQGKVPGLQVYSSTGNPGEIQSVRLHGIGSLGASSTPLYILDGIAVSATTFRSVNPNDIEDITVLKDASATSIYGSRAANGVIYVTTKRGSSTKSEFNVRVQAGTSMLANTSFYDNIMGTDQLLDFWLETGIRSQTQIDNLITSLGNDGQVKADGSLYSTNWNEYLQPSRPMFQADVSFMGGAKGTQYFISGSVYNEEGTAPGAYFERYTLASNVDSRIYPWLKVGANMRLSMSERETNPNWGSNYTSGGLSFLLQPYYSPTDQDGNRYDFIPGLNMAEPNYSISKMPDTYTYYGGILNGYIEIEPIKNLIIKTTPGLDATGVRNNWYRYPSYIGTLGNGVVGKATEEDYTATITNTVEYSFDFLDNHQIVALVGQEGVANDNKFYHARSEGQTDDRLMELQHGTQDNFTMSSSTTASNFLSYFGRVDYSFDRRFYVDASVRNDKSSRFGKNNQSATFWSVGGMWNLKNEAFLKDVSFLNLLNAKVSYGTQGNAGIGDFTALATIGATTDYLTEASWALGSPGNPDLTWETQTKLTVGASTRMFNMLTLSVEYYNRKTEDMLMAVPIPGTTGVPPSDPSDHTIIVNKNVGTLTNNGIDIALDLDILQGQDYYLGFNTVFNYNSEKITELFDGLDRWTIANTGVAYVVGKPVMYYYPIYAGVDPDDGLQQWYVPGEDIDETTEDSDNLTKVFNEDDLMQNTGIRRYAPISGGFGISGSWKGIGVGVDFAYVLGKNLISNDRFFSENPNQFAGYNTSSNVLDYWKQPGDNTYYPNWSSGETMKFDTHLIEKADFLRMKNITVSYSIPKHLMAKTNFMKGFRVYFTGRNLLTFTNKDFKGIDPEVDSNLTLGKVGNSKQFVFGVDFTF